MSKLAIVSEAAARKVVTRRMAYEAVQQAFEAVATGGSTVFDVVLGRGLHDGEVFALKSGLDNDNGRVGFKCGTYWAGNAAQGLPAHGSTILLLDPNSGFPQALVNASYLNGFRTAAADAIAVDHLARDNASVLGVIGAGHQAEQEIRAVAEVRPLSLIKISTRSKERADWISGRLEDIDTEIRMTDAETAVRDSDIVVTVTPSTSPLVLDDWVGAGMHISAMGADAQGKQELDTGILSRARLFAEYPRQSIAIGEFETAATAGLIDSADDIVALGAVTLGHSPGRTSADDITVFDSSGIASQDLAIAAEVLDAANCAGLVQYLEL